LKDHTVFLGAALESIARIQSYIHGYDQSQFLTDTKTQDAVIRNLEVIGQALKDFGIDALVAKHPEVPWRAIAGMRNLLAHEYLGVDTAMVWETVQIHLEPLRLALESLLKNND
jgi:uncharacterized protein with HEPN domain